MNGDLGLQVELGKQAEILDVAEGRIVRNRGTFSQIAVAAALFGILALTSFYLLPLIRAAAG